MGMLSYARMRIVCRADAANATGLRGWSLVERKSVMSVARNETRLVDMQGTNSRASLARLLRVESLTIGYYAATKGHLNAVL
jgi:hypothetical protein